MRLHDIREEPNLLQARRQFLKRKETELASNVRGFAMSEDRKKMMIREGGQYVVMDAGAGAKGFAQSVQRLHELKAIFQLDVLQ